jgi:hypothetical protein
MIPDLLIQGGPDKPAKQQFWFQVIYNRKTPVLLYPIIPNKDSL